MELKYQDYIDEAYEKLHNLLNAINEKPLDEFFEIAVQERVNIDAAIPLLNMAWKIKPTELSDLAAAYYYYVYALLLAARKDFKTAKTWTVFVCKHFPEQEISWLSAFTVARLEMMDSILRFQSGDDYARALIQSGGLLGSIIGQGVVTQKMGTYLGYIAEPSMKLASIRYLELIKAFKEGKPFEEVYQLVEEVVYFLNQTKNTVWWGNAKPYFQRLLEIDWDKLGQDWDQGKVKKLTMEIQSVLFLK